ncbi:hypothetical protein GOP47_0013893 [Adiantum capillus-veneris]|uniref:Cytochrome P450 n=1 Tax=Adiantum capillus-veneris TaxID=13818 RepID=A0A9D4UPV6_ADICA|nr:hypothetical protein GOP47_0013893 [Adiantum capillus-veneris]
MVQPVWHTSTGGQIVGVLGALTVSLLILLLLLLLHRRGSRPALNLPPCPFPPLPLLANLLHLRKVLRSPLRHTFGPIFTLHLGRGPLVVVTSATLAHEALVMEGRLFADRPRLPSRIVFTSNFRNINSAPYGPHWRTLRRNLVQEMLSVPKILSFKPGRTRVLTRLVSAVMSEAVSNQGVVSVYSNIRVAMFELLLLMCFGFHMPENDILQMSALLDDVVRFAAGQIVDFFPLLNVFNRKKRKEGTLRARQVQIFTSHLEKHNELKTLGQLMPGSYVETLLQMNVPTDEMVTLCSEFMVGGTDTTATTLEWAMAQLVRNPSIQNKVYNQMRDIVGDRLVEETDLQQLTYLQAVIKETLRLHPPGHMLLPHAVSECCKLGGYDIPSNAIVMFDVISMARDPAIWEEPLSFKPERFMEATAQVDITGSKEVTMIPFGAGRRICPGLGLATMHMEMFVAHLMQSFEWASSPAAGEAVDLTENPVFTVRMKHPLKAVVRDRKKRKG